ncbi:DEAD/DEAH box helicase [Picosynechococcus sp. PCC 73109]|uniref:DEAD/DEAH box helicase n=1 Tax=Picosynechococcus sp. PCC 73109 TaxID=374982 RepID=UPI001E5A3755|nr:AAA domain-containing protein [Picosynechococcus sp. PCC 73109]
MDCLAWCKRTAKPAFKPTLRARNLAYEYQFDPSQEFKGASSSFYVLGLETAEGKPISVTFLKDHSHLEQGLIVVQAKEEPPAVISLIPNEYVDPKPISEAIATVATDYDQGQLAEKSPAIVDFLTRSKPRFQDHYCFPDNSEAIAPSRDPQERLQQVINAVRHLDRSYLTIQGPPGAGKSYTGKHIIADLVRTGVRVGIASNSHKAINNLLFSTAQYCREQRIQATFTCAKISEQEAASFADYGIFQVKNSELASHVQPSCVLGTTAWGFSREDMAEQLDYLFIDEAGQVAVANLVAMARSAKNLVLMGDQMQLGQPSQAAHPADSGLSCLDYLLRDQATIPREQGVFLGTTYRLHSQINQLISEHIYDGELDAYDANDQRRLAISSADPVFQKEAGVIFVPVEHQGNSQASPEEVRTIQKLVNQLLGRTYHTGNPEQLTRPIDWDDMLFVAPYNHQVQKLRQALGDQAKIGSVDKFQGQEAPIVFLSMCSSDANESPRGIDFLFDRNRLNVAISRAQTLAIIVGQPALRQTSVSRVEQLKLVNFFNALTSVNIHRLEK